MNAQDMREFNAFLRNCTDSQLRGVYEKEIKDNRTDYVMLVLNEAGRRGIGL